MIKLHETRPKTKKNLDQELVQPEPSSIPSEQQANYFRYQCIREIARLMSKLNDTTIPEVKLRFYNNQVNRLLKMKSKWSQRIVELGGRIPLPPGSKLEDEIAIDNTYRYFGLAKFLPGVQEILNEKVQIKELALAKLNSRAQLYQQVGLDYFEFEDSIDADPALLQLENEAQREMIKSISNGSSSGEDSFVDAKSAFPFSHSIPMRQQVTEFLILQKKKQLLNKYTV